MNELVIPGGQVSGHFVISSDQRGVLAEFDNLITDAGLSRMYSYDYLNYCYVGTGSTPPTVNDTALVNRVGTTNKTNGSTNTVQSTPPYFAEHTKYYEFPVGTATGNLTEVGVGWLDSGVYKLFSRALILDAGGLPTTITILSTEMLRVTYSLRLYIPTGDTTGTITLGGNIGGTHNWTLRAAQITTSGSWQAGQPMGPSYVYSGPWNDDTVIPRIFAYSEEMGTLFTQPTGHGVSCTGDRGTTTSASWGVTSGSITVKSLWITNYSHGRYQVEFDPPISKSNLQTLTLSWSNPSWSRYVAP